MAAKKQRKKTEPAPPYQVLARRFRPKTLDELVGQEAILGTMRRALDSQQVPHAFLFSGSRGVGKTTLARILARCLNCEKGVSSSPCGTCRACQSILEGGHGDVMEIDAASHNLVDDIRELRDRVGFASMGGRYKVYILDEVHMLTRSAFNAFLKTLEEPPPNVVFILATTELHKVPDTIRSRCQVLLFQSLREQDIVTRLGTIAADEGLEIPQEVFLEIARAARGGMRDSETMLERILPVAREMGDGFDVQEYRKVVHRTGLEDVVAVVDSLGGGEAAPAMRFVAELVASGVDEREVLGEILEVLRAVLLLKVDGPETGLVAFTGELRDSIRAVADRVETSRIDAMIQAGLHGRERIRRVDDRRLVLEISLLRMAEAGRLPSLADLIEQVESGSIGAGSIGAGSIESGAGARPRSGAPASAPSGGSPPTATAGLKGRLLAKCREKRGVLLPTLELCSVREPDEAGVVRIVVQTERKLHQDRMKASGVQDEVRGLLREVLGADVTLDVVVGESGAAKQKADPGGAGASARRRASEAPESPPSGGRARPGSAARKVLDRFDGRVVDVDESASD